jgi:hypothetical protein
LISRKFFASLSAKLARLFVLTISAILAEKYAALAAGRSLIFSGAFSF